MTFTENITRFVINLNCNKKHNSTQIGDQKLKKKSRLTMASARSVNRSFLHDLLNILAANLNAFRILRSEINLIL